MARYGKSAQAKVKKVMQERKRGTLKSGRSGKKVQAANRRLRSDLQKPGRRARKSRGRNPEPGETEPGRTPQPTASALRSPLGRKNAATAAFFVWRRYIRVERGRRSRRGHGSDSCAWRHVSCTNSAAGRVALYTNNRRRTCQASGFRRKPGRLQRHQD